jgi:hypothetical protein
MKCLLLEEKVNDHKILFDYSHFSQVISVNEMFHLEPSPRSIEEIMKCLSYADSFVID